MNSYGNKVILLTNSTWLCEKELLLKVHFYDNKIINIKIRNYVSENYI